MGKVPEGLRVALDHVECYGVTELFQPKKSVTEIFFFFNSNLISSWGTPKAHYPTIYNDNTTSIRYRFHYNTID
uniref:Uncharacterized protein n=1 Tax=Spermophilus dauricus TaxID=99837 RepID=A0A8C9P115_SPEDA